LFAPAPFKLAVLDDTKRRPLTSTKVRCDPRPYRSTKFWAMPNPACVFAGLDGETLNAGSSASACPTSR
jgi:hypothetical protein